MLVPRAPAAVAPAQLAKQLQERFSELAKQEQEKDGDDQQDEEKQTRQKKGDDEEDDEDGDEGAVRAAKNPKRFQDLDLELTAARLAVCR